MLLQIAFVFLFFFMGYSQTDISRPCNVVETIIGGSIVNIVNVNDMIAFLLTSKNTIYRSSDGGVNWIDQSPILPDWSPGLSGVTIMAQSLNPFLIYFAGNSGDIWITSDGGMHYNHLTNIIPGYTSYVVDILPHPTNATYVACVMEICITLSECFGTVIFSKDATATWISVQEYTYQDFVTWGPSGSPGHLDTEFYGLYYFLDSSKNLTNGFLATSNLNDFTKPLGDVSFGGIFYAAGLDTFLLLSFVPSVELYQVPSSSLKNPTLQKEVFPQTKRVTPIDNIEIADSSPGSIFLAVHKSQQPNNSLELFVSNSLNSQFQLSLDDIFATGYPPSAELLKLQGIQEGIFLANRWINPTSIQTVITSNKGENWTTLTAPANELQNCTNCTLQFFGSTAFTGGLYAKIDPFSLGVIIGVAMVGPHLINDPSLANLYISRDAGKTWSKLRSGSWRFDSSATTGFIALAQFQGPTTNLIYTFDEGESWSTCALKPSTSDTRDLYVDSVSTSLVAPLQSTGVWVVTHWLDSKGDTSFSIIHAQFNTSFQSCGASDYEVVSFEDGCVLGQQTWIRRKKGSSVCKVDTSMNLTFVTPCNCTRNDYTCAHCFVETQGECLLNDSAVCTSLGNPPGDCPPGGTYLTPIGYVRIQGTKCINDLPFLTPNQQPCPSLPAPLPSDSGHIPNSDSVPTSGPISTPTSGPVSTPTSGPISTPTSGPITPSGVSLPSPSPFSSQNGSDLSSNDDSASKRIREAGFIALGVILGVLFVVVIIVVVVKFCTTPAADSEMELT